MNKKIIRFGFSILSLLIVLCGSAIPAFAAGNRTYGYYEFKTNDGKWDGSFRAYSGENVEVFINGWTPSNNPSKPSNDNLSVRLCRKGGGCTIAKLITPGNNSRWFTNMAAGNYYADVEKVSNPNTPVTGMIDFSVGR